MGVVITKGPLEPPKTTLLGAIDERVAAAHAPHVHAPNERPRPGWSAATCASWLNSPPRAHAPRATAARALLLAAREAHLHAYAGSDLARFLRSLGAISCRF